MSTALETARKQLQIQIDALELANKVTALFPTTLPIQPRSILKGGKDYVSLVVFEVETVKEVKDIYSILTPMRVEGDKGAYFPVRLYVGTRCQYIGGSFQWEHILSNGEIIHIHCKLKGSNGYAYSTGRKARIYYSQARLETDFDKYGMNENITSVCHSWDRGFDGRYKNLPNYTIYWEYNTEPIK